MVHGSTLAGAARRGSLGLNVGCVGVLASQTFLSVVIEPPVCCWIIFQRELVVGVFVGL